MKKVVLLHRSFFCAAVNRLTAGLGAWEQGTSPLEVRIQTRCPCGRHLFFVLPAAERSCGSTLPKPVVLAEPLQPGAMKT